MDTGVCLFCGQSHGFVFVHGHYQCQACKNVQVRCCEGSSDVSSGACANTYANKKRTGD